MDVVVFWVLTSPQHASVSQGRICTDNFTCCHTEIKAVDQAFHLTQSQYTDTGPTTSMADPLTRRSEEIVKILELRNANINLIIKASTSRPADLRSIQAFAAGFFFGSSRTSEFIGTALASLSGARCCRVSVGIGWPGVSILRPGERAGWSATSVSVWQPVQLSSQIRP